MCINFVHGGANYVHGRYQFNDINYARDELFFREKKCAGGSFTFQEKNNTDDWFFSKRETMQVVALKCGKLGRESDVRREDNCWGGWDYNGFCIKFYRDMIMREIYVYFPVEVKGGEKGP